MNAKDFSQGINGAHGRSAPRRQGAAAPRLLRRRLALGAAASLAIAGWAAFHGEEGAPAATGASPAVHGEWREGAPSTAMFELDAAALGFGRPVHHILSRDGARKEAFASAAAPQGEAGEAPSLRLVLRRPAEPARASFFVDLARLSAEAGRAVTFAAQPAALRTRLGMFEAAEVVISRRDGEPVSCTGFRNAASAGAVAPLAVTGFFCSGAPGSQIASARRETACLIDAIDLTARTPDGDLAALFAARDLNAETDCAAQALISLSDP